MPNPRMITVTMSVEDAALIRSIVFSQSYRIRELHECIPPNFFSNEQLKIAERIEALAQLFPDRDTPDAQSKEDRGSEE
jgi:hypothetical protein